MKNQNKIEFEKDIHYYLEDGRVVFTEKYLIQRGQCCGSKCRHCPFFPSHKKGVSQLLEKSNF